MLGKFQEFYQRHYYKIVITLTLVLWTAFVFGLGLTLGLLQKERQLIFQSPPGAQAELGPEFFQKMRQLWDRQPNSK